ncbi:hypothetical protein [Dyella sp.]|uniref:hypothetical protein n=1 Tax=Dyella sp. TaxID=1869338 RepID=UPI002FDA5BBA
MTIVFGITLTMVGYIQWVFTDYREYLKRPLLFRAWQLVFWVGVLLMCIGCAGICVRVHI